MRLDLAAMLSLEYARVRSSPSNSFAKSPPAQETVVLPDAVHLLAHPGADPGWT
jgi:hypothetical protein